MKKSLVIIFTILSLKLPAQQNSGAYKVRLDQPRQIIAGLGVEVQTDAIGSGNVGLPEEVIAMPNNLVDAERKRLYKDLLKGFRYCRLAMGLYFRGLDESKKHIIERYPNQLKDLKEMILQSGMEGIAMEYWSPAPYWKSTDSYIGGGLKKFEPAFLNEFGDALVKDIQYLRANGIKISMWGLQNESVHTLEGSKQSYSHCSYTPEQYVTTFRAVAPKIKIAIPDAQIIVDSWDGHTGKVGEELRKDTTSLRFIDAWALHRIGQNSNNVIRDTTIMNRNTFGKPVFQNEYEYFTPVNDTFTINTAQSIMNWFTFVNSPTWFWLHALKPTYNSEASGFSLGFWRPQDDNNFSKNSSIKKGYWDYNPQNFNAIAGFLKYMPWNAQRYAVDEDVLLNDNRILAFKTPKGKLVLVMTNRSGNSFTFNINTGINKKFNGYRYTPTQRNIKIGSLKGQIIKPTLPDLSIEFWVEE